jgi:hypothetical protein
MSWMPFSSCSHGFRKKDFSPLTRRRWPSSGLPSSPVKTRIKKFCNHINLGSRWKFFSLPYNLEASAKVDHIEINGMHAKLTTMIHLGQIQN